MQVGEGKDFQAKKKAGIIGPRPEKEYETFVDPDDIR